MAKKSTSQRVFAIISIIISGLVLVLALAGIIGVWSLRATAINITTGVLDGVGELAQVGRNGVTRLDTRLTGLQTTVNEIESAVDQVGQNVEDKGLVMTLLPQEKEQRLEDTAQQITDGLASIKDAVQAVRDLKRAIDQIPFVNLPEPEAEKVAATQESIDSLRSGVTDLKNNVREFREESAAEISKISTAAENVGNRVAISRENLAEIDGRLEALQNGATNLAQSLAIYITVAIVIVTLMFAWVIYAMVVLIQRALAQLRNEN
jgi:archaellum component FlaC